MAKELQLRGGTTAQHSSFTGAAREVTVDTDKDVLVVHDNVTAGGIPMAKASDLAYYMEDLVDDLTPQLGGDLDLNGHDVPVSTTQQAALDLKQKILASSYTQIADASLGTGTHTFDYSAGDGQQLTVTGDITIAFSNFVSGKICSFIIELVNGGGSTITWPTGIEFDAKTAPTLTASGTDVLSIVKDKDEVYSLYVLALDRGTA